MPGGQSGFLVILILPVIGIFFYISMKNKKKKGQKVNSSETDEVWATIKRYLKANGEVGKEVVDSFVAKRIGKEWKKRDVYVVTFITKDAKSLVIDDPRAIEVEIVSNRIDRKNYDRKIRVNGIKDFMEESNWINTLRQGDIERKQKTEDEERKKVDKLRKKQLKIKEKSKGKKI